MGQIKERIRSARLRASLTVNHEMILLYWQGGRDILQRQAKEGWGAKVIDRLAADLHRAFPDATGLSPRNLKYMRAFAADWPDEPIVQQAAAQIPWFHNCVILDKIKDPKERLCYARATVDPLEVGGEDFYIYLLFYHLKLRCYIVIDLKMTPFKPEYAGKMNFYLSAADDLLRHPDDKPSIGIILCKAKNQVVAEYALRDLSKPVGISTYITKLVESLPPALRGSLPSPEALEAELKKGATPKTEAEEGE